MKKVLIVTDLDMKRYDSGTEIQLSFLQECLKRNIHVEYILPTEPCSIVKDKLKQVNFTYTVLKSWWNKNNINKRNNIKICFPILKIILDKKFNLVAFNFCEEITVLMISIISLILLRKPKIIWHQHCEIENVNLKFSLKKYISKLRFLSLFIDLICPVFRKQEEVLILRGINRSKIKTLYNGIRIERFDEPIDDAIILKEFDIKPGSKIIVTVASLIERKGLEYLIRAAAIILKNNPKTEFLIVGGGPLLNYLKKLANQLQIDPNLHFLGIRNDVHAIMHVADVFALASLAEPFGLVNIEAMAAKKPIVATNVGGIPEIVEDNISGFLVPSRDHKSLASCIIRLLDNEKLAQEMGKKGRKIAEQKFSINEMVKNYLDTYEFLMK